MGKTTYKYIGDRNLKDAKTLLEAGSFSSAGRFAQQAVEKYLKHFIDISVCIENLLLRYELSRRRF